MNEREVFIRTDVDFCFTFFVGTISKEDLEFLVRRRDSIHVKVCNRLGYIPIGSWIDYARVYSGAEVIEIDNLCGLNLIIDCVPKGNRTTRAVINSSLEAFQKCQAANDKLFQSLGRN